MPGRLRHHRAVGAARRPLRLCCILVAADFRARKRPGRRQIGVWICRRGPPPARAEPRRPPGGLGARAEVWGLGAPAEETGPPGGEEGRGRGERGGGELRNSAGVEDPERLGQRARGQPGRLGGPGPHSCSRRRSRGVGDLAGVTGAAPRSCGRTYRSCPRSGPRPARPRSRPRARPGSSPSSAQLGEGERVAGVRVDRVQGGRAARAVVGVAGRRSARSCAPADGQTTRPGRTCRITRARSRRSSRVASTRPSG